ncbi:hypothetical protein C0J52_26652 [Blattella germanica]|nr:hypothetical protein C0J52_26652 [Blattella germanica]
MKFEPHRLSSPSYQLSPQKLIEPVFLLHNRKSKGLGFMQFLPPTPLWIPDHLKFLRLCVLAVKFVIFTNVSVAILETLMNTTPCVLSSTSFIP